MKNDDKWSKDKTYKYFQGFENKVLWPSIKILILSIVFAASLYHGLGVAKTFFLIIALVGMYPHFICLLSGGKLIYMPAMDQASFISTSKSHVNFMSVTGIEGEFSFDFVKHKVLENSRRFPKFRYKIVNKFGDLYYEEMEINDALDKAVFFETDKSKGFKSQHEVDMYIRDNMNIKMPMDGPQYRMSYYYLTDEDGKETMVQIWKSHHCFMDGVSCMAVQACFSDEYSTDYFVKTNDISKWVHLLLRFAAPFYLPVLLLNTAMTFRDRNVLTKGKKSMSGLLNCASSSRLDFREIKKLSKLKKVTVNDIVMGATSVAFKQYFKLRGDKLGEETAKPSVIQCIIPVNIRFSMYKSYEEV
mmetsp:Transcript_1953/g.3388  ORF Transcript_1953/g.3388 Transcript_1953/m.3388 type:complete len:359 (-) Transcript_1953:686-1762(-)